jgi:hypothetical protein
MILGAVENNFRLGACTIGVTLENVVVTLLIISVLEMIV